MGIFRVGIGQVLKRSALNHGYTCLAFGSPGTKYIRTKCGGVWRARVCTIPQRHDLLVFSTSLYVVVLIFPTMTSSSSIFENGRLKPGIYKIQNLSSETYLDIHRHSKELCCRPARDLEDGGGLVRLSLPLAICVSDS